MSATIEVDEIARLRIAPDEVLVIRADWDAETAERAMALLYEAGIERAIVIPDASVRLDVVEQEAIPVTDGKTPFDRRCDRLRGAGGSPQHFIPPSWDDVR